jgi:hypothetical protein
MPPADMAGLRKCRSERPWPGTSADRGLLLQIERTPRLLTVKDVKVRGRRSASRAGY